MVFGNREGIGRYGMGMKTAALSMSPTLEAYSWQEPLAFYSMTLDVDDIGGNKSNLIELPDPILHDQLPSEIADVFTRPMSFPKNPHETQSLIATSRDELHARLGEAGTIVFMPECDRLTYKTPKSLVEHATKEMGRIYRRFIAKGLKLYVNNRLVEAFDPTYWMQTARHTRVEGLTEKRSKLIDSWPIEVPVADGSQTTTTVQVRLFALPYEEWGGLSRKILNSDLHVFDGHAVSFMRNDREVEIGWEPKLKIRKHSDFNWIRLEVDFTGGADEGFGVAANKQGARLKEYVAQPIVDKINETVITLRNAVKQAQAKRAAQRSGAGLGESERRANESEAFQGKPLPEVPQEERAALEDNLRGLAVTLKRASETDDQALGRVKESRYLMHFTHDEYWPFYHCDFKYGKIILTINTAHQFFTRVWKPLSELANATEAAQEIGDDSIEVPTDVGGACREVLLGIQSMLFSLARTQSQMNSVDDGQSHQRLFDTLRKQWSENLTTQLQTK
jgi:hypothetical protein